MDKLVSIIVPIYNGRQYIERCIKTLNAQTYKNLQIILVDDGSTDGSAELCNNYAKADKRIVCVHKANGGLSTARNAGLSACRGDFVTFLDVDDWLEADGVEYLLKMICKYSADIAEFQLQTVYGENEKARQKKEKVTLLEGKGILEDYLLTVLKIGDYSFCTCLFRKEVLDGFVFREGKINTDLDDKYRAFNGAKRYVKSNQTKYYYFQNPDSLTRAGLKKRDFNIFDSAESLIELTASESERIKKLATMKQARAYFSLLAKISYFGFHDQELNTKDTINKLTKGIRSNYPLLMRSPIQLNRKIMITVTCIDYRILKYALLIYRKIANR